MPTAIHISPVDPIGTFDATDAWLSLSHLQRDLIGSLAIRMAFAGFCRQDMSDEPLWFTEEIRAEAGRQEDDLLGALLRTIDQALPAVFGTDANPPTWPDAARPGETDEQFLDRVLVQPLLEATAPFTAPSDDRRTDHELEVAASAAGWLKQDGGTWCRLADANEVGAEPFGNGRHVLHLQTAADACERDGIRTDRQIADAAIHGLRRVFVPASMLAGA